MKKARKYVEKPGDCASHLEETCVRLENCEAEIKRLRTKLYKAHNKDGHVCSCTDCEIHTCGDEFIAADTYYNRLFDGSEAT